MVQGIILAWKIFAIPLKILASIISVLLLDAWSEFIYIREN